MTRRVDQEVVWLDVAVDPSHLVSFFNAQDHFCHVEFGVFFTEYIMAHQVLQEIAPNHELHDEVEIRVVLKTRDKRDNPL